MISLRLLGLGRSIKDLMKKVTPDVRDTLIIWLPHKLLGWFYQPKRPIPLTAENGLLKAKNWAPVRGMIMLICYSFSVITVPLFTFSSFWAWCSPLHCQILASWHVPRAAPWPGAHWKHKLCSKIYQGGAFLRSHNFTRFEMRSRKLRWS